MTNKLYGIVVALGFKTKSTGVSVYYVSDFPICLIKRLRGRTFALTNDSESSMKGKRVIEVIECCFLLRRLPHAGV